MLFGGSSNEQIRTTLMESEMLSGFVSNYVQLKVNNIYSHCGIFKEASWRISKDYAQKYKLVLCRVERKRAQIFFV